MEIFAVWTVSEQREMSTNLMDTISKCPFLDASFVIDKPKITMSRTKRNYFTVLDSLNTAICFIHGLLYDDTFARFALKLDIVPYSFLFFNCDFRNCLFAYITVAAFGRMSTCHLFDLAQGYPIFSSIVDRMCSVLKCNPPAKRCKEQIYEQIFAELDIVPTTLSIDILRHNTYLYNKFDPLLYNNIFLDFVQLQMDYSKDRDDRWNENAIKYFKKRPDCDMIFFSHLQHFTRRPNNENHGLAITEENVIDLEKQREQKTVVVNAFLHRCQRDDECRFFANKPHDNLFLIPYDMGTLQYLLMTQWEKIQKYPRVEVFDDRPHGILKWSKIDDVNEEQIKIMFRVLIPKLTVHISPSDYGLTQYTDLNKNFHKSNIAPHIMKFLTLILKSIIYREDLYVSKENLPELWGWSSRRSSLVQNALLFTD